MTKVKNMEKAGNDNTASIKNGLYIYGMIKSSDPQDFGSIGIGNPASQVETIGFKDIAAVISQSPFEVYDSLAREKIVADLVTHQSVIESVMKRFTLLPVKFGTMVETEEEVITFLEKGYTLLHDELGKAEGKIELDVAASWAMPKMLAALYRHNSQIQAKQREIVRQGHEVSIENKVALGKLIEQALETKQAECHQLILQTLARETLEVHLSEVADAETIFSAAFLLEKKREEAFNQAVDGLNERLEDTVNFRIVGPLPLYNFSTILLESIDLQRVEEARNILGLQGEVTEKTVRDAYHRLARKYHPDKRSAGNSDDSPQFRLLHSAYKTLKTFLQDGLMHVEILERSENYGE